MGCSASSSAVVAIDDPNATSKFRPVDPNWDINKVITDMQLEEFRDAFRMFDTDGSGAINADELRALMESVGQAPTEQELANMIAAADVDGSATVDFAEFCTLMAHKMADVRAAPARVPYIVALDPACSPYSCARGQDRVALARCLLDLRLLVGRVHTGG